MISAFGLWALACSDAPLEPEARRGGAAEKDGDMTGFSPVEAGVADTADFAVEADAPTPADPPAARDASVPTAAPDAAPPTAPPTAPPSLRASPGAQDTWQIQYAGALDLELDVQVFNLDLADTPEAAIAALRARGTYVLCYFSAGSFEEWREDADQFPPAALGEPLDDWPGERWLDVRDPGLRPIMEARLDRAVEKGCDGVDPDNVDGFANDTGFDYGSDAQLAYNRFLAGAAHARGLTIGLKNDLDQAEALVSDFDWAVNEECFAYDECEVYTETFVAQGKPVFQIEYVDADEAETLCPQSNALGLNTLIKRLELDAERVACRPNAAPR
ncbi:MAG: endo alpha-1,4 polygalactosaminidase [Bradymonadia bacterium]